MPIKVFATGLILAVAGVRRLMENERGEEMPAEKKKGNRGEEVRKGMEGEERKMEGKRR